MLTLILTSLLRGVGTHRTLVLENVALRHQLAVLQRSAPRARLRPSDRLFWVLLSRLWRGWAEVVSVVQPATVIRWQRTGFTLFWTWKSRRNGPGRPAVAPEIRALLRRMSKANPLLYSIRPESEVRREDPSLPRKQRAEGRGGEATTHDGQALADQSNHLGSLVSVDSFVVPAVMFKVLFVFVVLAHDRRRYPQCAPHVRKEVQYEA